MTEDDEQRENYIEKLESFWLRNAINIPNWYRASRDILLIAPSSAAIERAFSILTQGFSDSQATAKEDYKQAAVRIRYNSNFH